MRRILTFGVVLHLFFLGVLPSFAAELYASTYQFVDNYPGRASFDGYVQRYDSTAGVLLGNLANGDHPQTLAFAPDGTLYVGYQAGTTPGAYRGYIERFNPTTGQSLGILTGVNYTIAPNKMAFGDDGNLYFSSGLSDVLKVDPLTGSILGSYDAPNNPIGIALKGDMLFVGSVSGGIQTFNTTTGQSTGLFSAQPSVLIDLAFAPDGNLYGVDSNQVSVFAPDGSLVNQFDVSSASAVTFGEDGNLYILAGESILRYSLDGTFLNTVASLNDSLTYTDLAFEPSVGVPEPSPMFTTLLIGGSAIGLAWKKQRKKNA